MLKQSPRGIIDIKEAGVLILVVGVRKEEECKQIEKNPTWTDATTMHCAERRAANLTAGNQSSPLSEALHIPQGRTNDPLSQVNMASTLHSLYFTSLYQNA